MSGLRTETISDPDRFEAVRDGWNRLSADSPFTTWDWFDPWWRAFGGRARMQVLAVWDGADLVGGAALGSRRRHIWAMANPETDLWSCVSRDEQADRAIAELLAGARASRATILALESGAPATERLLAQFRRSGWVVVAAQRESCPIIRTDRTVDAYRAALSSNARRQITKSAKRLEREGAVELAALRGEFDVESAIREGFELEARGWKGRERSAMASSDASSRFWTDLFRRSHRLGTLRWSELRLEGQLIAFCFALVHGDRVYAMKTSYDERFSYFSPGHILRDAIIRACIEEGFEAQELLGPLTRWKERYTTETRETLIVRAYRRRPVPLLRYAARRWALPWVKPRYLELRSRVRRRGDTAEGPAGGPGAG